MRYSCCAPVIDQDTKQFNLSLYIFVFIILIAIAFIYVCTHLFCMKCLMRETFFRIYLIQTFDR